MGHDRGSPFDELRVTRLVSTPRSCASSHACGSAHSRSPTRVDSMIFRICARDVSEYGKATRRRQQSPNTMPVLWPEVDRGPEGSVHVKGRGVVLVRDAPRAVDLAQAYGRTEPQVDLLRGAVRRRGEAVVGVREGGIFARGHGHVAGLLVPLGL